MHEDGPEAGVSPPLTGTPPRVHMRGPAVAAQVATARHAVLDSAKAHGIGRAPRNDIALAVSEACTNVVMHAYRGAAFPGPLAVDAHRDNGAFVVVVCDEGIGMSPRADSPGLGLGLGLISHLTRRVEITSNEPVGATITMVFAAPEGATQQGRTAPSSDRGEVEKTTGMEAPEM
jgi:serine/threonine-protein kinase RsbW